MRFLDQPGNENQKEKDEARNEDWETLRKEMEKLRKEKEDLVKDLENKGINFYKPNRKQNQIISGDVSKPNNEIIYK